MKILFYEVRHFSPNFHKCTPNFVCVYFYWFENNICQKNISPKILEFFFIKIRFRLL